MRSIPFTPPKVEQPYREKEPETPGTAPEVKPEAEAPSIPEPPKQEKTFLEKYGIVLLLIAGAAIVYFFSKYKIVPRVAAVIS